MRRFFVSADQLTGGRAVLSGGDADHLARSLRARPGERIVVVDGCGREHGVRLDEISPGRVSGPVTWSRPATSEPRLRVHVVQALPKDGMGEAVDAMAAAGAASIRPCITERTIVRPDATRRALRATRWQGIARQAAQLAGRGTVPPVHPLLSLAEACSTLPDRARILACVVNEPTTALSRLEVATDLPVVLCIGPEGDFAPADLRVLSDAGAEAVHLGPRVLRARLAGAIALSLMLACSGDLDRPVMAQPEDPQA